MPDDLAKPFEGELPLKISDNISFNNRLLNRSLETDWGIGSFSWLIRNISHGDRQAEPEREDLTVSYDLIAEEGNEMVMIFKKGGRILPKGARTGSAIHEIFEEMDFTGEMPKDLFETKLRKYGIINPVREEEYNELLDITETMIQNVLNTPIPLAGNNSDLMLAQISDKCRLNELEFYYPIHGITPQNLARVFREHGVDHVGTSFARRMEHLDFNLREGFMHGFIDLIFEHNGKYYVLDWKSNWLGETSDAYTPKAIEKSMVDSCYILQYHIYVLAVHLWLKSRDASYSYAEKFGGVIYTYVRGMDSRFPGGSIYFDRPGEDLMVALAQTLGLEPGGGDSIKSENIKNIEGSFI